MIRTKSTEGHYTIKRVDKLPKKGNTNWLFVIRGPIIDKLYRWDIYSKDWEIIYLNSQGFIPEDTVLDFNSQTNELSLQFSDGTVITTIMDISGTITTYEDSLTTDKNKIGQYTNEEGTIIDIFETTTNLTVEGNEIVYTKEDGTEAREDLSFIIAQAQDLNVVSGTYVENMSTIVLTKNNGDNVSITLTGLGGSFSTTVVSLNTGNTIASSNDGTTITNIEETITSLIKNGTNLEYTRENGVVDIIDVQTASETLTSIQLISDTLRYLDEEGNQTDIIIPTSTQISSDFYEEGAFLGELEDDVSGVTYNISNNNNKCNYVRAGNKVTLFISFTGITTTGTSPSNAVLRVTNIPFTSSSLNKSTGSISRFNPTDLTEEEMKSVVPFIAGNSNFVAFNTIPQGNSLIGKGIFNNGSIQYTITYLTDIYQP